MKLFAIKTDLGYFCEQNKVGWYQDEPVGWCLVSKGYQHLITMAEIFGIEDYTIEQIN